MFVNLIRDLIKLTVPLSVETPDSKYVILYLRPATAVNALVVNITVSLEKPAELDVAC